MIMGLVGENPLVAGTLAAGAGALAVDAERARFQRQQASLASALVGGPAFGDTRTMLGLGVMAAAQQMSTSAGEGAGIAQQLAGAGMRPGQVAGNLQNVLGMTKGYGLQTGDVEPLVAALGTAGGMSAAQIKQALQDLVDMSGKATGSLQQLTTGMGAVTAVNAAFRDTASLAAVQRAVGPTSGINAGQLMAPAMGATGTNALQIAGMLGMTPDEFAAAQASPMGMAKIFDRYAALARSAGPGATGTYVAETLLPAAGMNLPGNAQQQANLVARLRTAPPGQALRYAQQRQQARRPPHASAAELARRQTSQWDQFWIGFGNLFTQATNDPQHEGGQALAARSQALAMTGPVPAPPATGPGGAAGGKFGLHTLPPAVVSGVQAAALAGGRASTDVTHTLRVEVVVKDQRGNQLAHKVDHARIVAGAHPTLRPPYDHPGRTSPPPWTGGTGGSGSGGGSSGFE